MTGLHLNDLERKILRLGERAVAIVKETLDKYAKEFYEEVMRVIPHKTGALAESARLKLVSKSNNKTDIYGWSMSFVGKAKNGMDYHDIAYILNYYGYGRWDTGDIATIREIGFISQSVSTLKQINKEINALWAKEVV